MKSLHLGQPDLLGHRPYQYMAMHNPDTDPAAPICQSVHRSFLMENLSIVYPHPTRQMRPDTDNYSPQLLHTHPLISLRIGLLFLIHTDSNANTKFMFQRANEILLKRGEINLGKFLEVEI